MANFEKQGDREARRDPHLQTRLGDFTETSGTLTDGYPVEVSDGNLATLITFSYGQIFRQSAGNKSVYEEPFNRPPHKQVWMD
nr:unnamed protein product [Haemonchus contortus]